MNMDHDHNKHGPGRSRFIWVLIGFLLVAGYFLITEHKAHLSGLLYYLPFLLLLACPLLHMFMHGGHGEHGGHGNRRDDGGEASDKHPKERKK